MTDEQIALPEVPHRNPLAQWKLLIRAIAYFHRNEDQACRECLSAIKPESVPARLVPAIQAMLGARPGRALKPAETALLSRTSVKLDGLRSALATLDQAFAVEQNEGRVFKAVREVVRECRRSTPDLFGQLKQIMFARGEVACLDTERLTAALDGAPRLDAGFFRMYARALETSGDAEDLYEACEQWDEFRRQAVTEGWFRAESLEVATLYLHMAEILQRAPDGLLEEFQLYTGSDRNPLARDDRYFVFPEKLYQRACVIDPHQEAFSQWMHWAAGRSAIEAENVCREWNRIRPDDLEPILYLMEQAAERNAFPTALAYLSKAERIDAVDPVVRAARLRLLAAGAMLHLQKKKPHLAAEKLVMMAALPQSRQGDRPAFLAALRHLICLGSGDGSGAVESRREVENLLEGPLAAGFLISGIAAVSKRLEWINLPPVEALSKQKRKIIPVSMARVMAIAEDLGISKFQPPVTYFAETAVEFRGASDALDIHHIRLLGELGIASEHPKLAWEAAEAGLKRGGPSEAHFMLLRAQAIPPGNGPRGFALAAAAVELGRLHRDTNVVDQALQIVRNPFEGKTISFTIDQAREVVRREMASPAFPNARDPGPDYSDLFPRELCPCPDCRRERGETFSFLDEEDDAHEFLEDEFEGVLNESIPEDMPPEIAQVLLEAMKEAFATGESPEKVLARVMGGNPGGGNPGGGKRKKGRKR